MAAARRYFPDTKRAHTFRSLPDSGHFKLGHASFPLIGTPIAAHESELARNPLAPAADQSRQRI